MNKYVRFDIVQAEPMTNNEYAMKYFNRPFLDPSSKDEQEGYRYLKESFDSEFAIWVWCPKETFEKLHHVLDKRENNVLAQLE